MSIEVSGLREAETAAAREAGRLREFVASNPGREVVVVQGIGFVGSAMLAALASVRQDDGAPRFAVVGVDLADERNAGKIRAVLEGVSPVVSADLALTKAYRDGYRTGNLTATADPAAIGYASVVVMDVNLDVDKRGAGARDYGLGDAPFRDALATVAAHIPEGALVIVETTVPPGTTEKLVQPVIEDGLRRRGLDPTRVRVAHSYERVMPGQNYLASITSYYRVFAGIDAPSSARARAFLETFIDTANYPLTELQSPTASEMAKVLENTFRAVNIALIQEWTEFAEAASVDLFAVIAAIRMRPTHKNIMSPGLGVGGYCLTKDSLLADWSARKFFGRSDHLGIALDCLDINDAMPIHTLKIVERHLPNLHRRRVLILGVSYLNDVADTRSSPTMVLFDALAASGADTMVHDPLVSRWPERNIDIDCRMEALSRMGNVDVVVFAVRHSEYVSLGAQEIVSLFPHVRLVVDANNVLTDSTAESLAERSIAVAGVGKGHWRKLGGSPPGQDTSR